MEINDEILLEYDRSLRPKRLEDYIGQDSIKELLNIFISSALKREETLDHVLLYGPPGLGKTTLAGIIANEMEDFVVDIIIGKDATSNTIKIDLPPFTLIGATTRAGDLSAPLRDRFGIVNQLNFYTVDELAEIVKRTSRIFQFDIEDEAAREIARRSRGTPRIANRLFRRVRDFAQFYNGGEEHISYELAKESLYKLEIDSAGLNTTDHRYLKTIIEKFKGGPAGLNAIAASISEDMTTIEDIYEPYLLQEGFIIRSPRGRIVTEKAYKHLGIEYVSK